MAMNKKIIIKNEVWKILKSNRNNKQLKAVRDKDNLTVHFGDSRMPEFPNTKRGDNYCSRSYGIGKKYGVLNDVKSPNFWSRKILWDCEGKKSKR